MVRFVPNFRVDVGKVEVEVELERAALRTADRSFLLGRDGNARQGRVESQTCLVEGR